MNAWRARLLATLERMPGRLTVENAARMVSLEKPTPTALPSMRAASTSTSLRPSPRRCPSAISIACCPQDARIVFSAIPHWRQSAASMAFASTAGPLRTMMLPVAFGSLAATDLTPAITSSVRSFVHPAAMARSRISGYSAVMPLIASIRDVSATRAAAMARSAAAFAVASIISLVMPEGLAA